MAIAQTLLTAEELERLPNPADMQRELVQGVLVEMSPVGKSHGSVVVRLGARLVAWADHGPHGYVGTETGFILAREPDIVRAPDLTYIRPERVAMSAEDVGYWTIAPDLAVEVVSPSESAQDVNQKVRDYLAAGTRLMWVIYPRTRQVIEYTSSNASRIYISGDTLEHDDVLPDFRCPVAELFA